MSKWLCTGRWFEDVAFLPASLVVSAGGEAKAEPKAEKVFAACVVLVPLALPSSIAVSRPYNASSPLANS